jgi:hypothetical protein
MNMKNIAAPGICTVLDTGNTGIKTLCVKNYFIEV